MPMKSYQEPKFEAIVNGLKCIAQVDTGADITGIPPHFSGGSRGDPGVHGNPPFLPE